MWRKKRIVSRDRGDEKDKGGKGNMIGDDWAVLGKEGDFTKGRRSTASRAKSCGKGRLTKGSKRRSTVTVPRKVKKRGRTRSWEEIITSLVRIITRKPPVLKEGGGQALREGRDDASSIRISP